MEQQEQQGVSVFIASSAPVFIVTNRCIMVTYCYSMVTHRYIIVTYRYIYRYGKFKSTLRGTSR